MNRVLRRARAALPILVGLAVLGAAVDRPADETIREIEERGMRIAASLEAVAKTRDRLAMQGGAFAPPDAIVAVGDRDLWSVFLLKEAAVGGAPGLPPRGMMILAQTDYSPAAADVGDLRAMVPPRAAPGMTVSYARAQQVAEKAAADQKRLRLPCDTAIVREKNGGFSIYLLPRPEAGGTAQFGGDQMARVAASGRQLQSIEALHTGDPVVVPIPGRATGQATLHTHTTGDLPTPTDVALVRIHPVLAPHLVMTPRHIFRIDREGKITWLGPNATPATGGRR